MKIVPLPADAKEKSYYKYLEEPLTQIPQEEWDRAKKCDGDPKLALPFAERARIQDPDYVAPPDGVYLMDDGTAFVSTTTPVPDITGEMAEWWIIWCELDPLRYAIWDPEDHYDISVSEEDRKHILDQSLAVRERGWGFTSYISESMNGEKPQKGYLPFIDPAKAGFDDSLLGTDASQAMWCVNNEMKKGPICVPILMTETLRKGTDGQNVWMVHAWMGHGIKDGKEVHKKIPMRKLVTPFAAQLVCHSHKEMGHLNKILPRLYAEQKDNWLD